MRRVHRSIRAALCGLAIALAGKGLLAHDDIDAQVARLTERIAENPDEAGLYIRLGELHRSHSDLAPALDDFSRAIALDPAQPAAFVGRSATLLAKGEPEGALAAAESAVRLDPESGMTHLAMARALAGLGRGDAADAAYAKTVALQQGGAPDLIIEYADALLTLSPPRQARALEVLLGAIGAIGPVITLVEPAVGIAQDLGRGDVALGLCDDILRILGDNPKWLVRRAEVLAASGDPVGARESYRAAASAIRQLPERRRKTAAMEALLESATTGSAAN